MKYAMLVLFITAILPLAKVYADSTNPPIKEQYPGHISPADLHNGVTTFDIHVHGEWVTCISAYEVGGRSGGVAITCDWNNQRR